MDHPFRTAADAASAEARNARRRSIFRNAVIRRPGKPDETLRVRNLSPGGLMADLTPRIAVGETVGLELDGIGAVEARVAWIEAGRMGLAFAEPIDPQQVGETGPRSIGATTTTILRHPEKLTRRPGLRVS